jgi:hypothetical protein
MLRNGRPLIEVFGAAEILFRRCSPDHIDEYEIGKFRVITASWPGIVSLSTVRDGCSAEPDHARWDSQVDPSNDDPKLYRDWYVVKIPVGQIPAVLQSSGGVGYEFSPKHVPYDDLYSHSEIHVTKGNKPIKEAQFNSAVKADYRAALAAVAVVVLRPEEIEPAVQAG